ncbi:PP2C family protein-serine/threonine phosphatase [Streptomyces sp. UNOC14_S4]|uniref:PP2C family protein-serine/threonine phosphatase n=1 Tax=Streptomyces sp. UNOC14_S4 TaxID=2872340 RepID=UPI001E46AAEC|nr:PP2C family protein-serine/threonine phosphatase [Streptomyces sp. UNOC14_S4]MCC3769260.1 serine/threonine-protein phosphatase [Streptomyces sp. UNOC14_S4]
MTHHPAPNAPFETPRLPRHARLLVVAGYALLVSAIVLDLAADPQWTLSPVLATAPVLASIGTLRARVPLAVGLCALALVPLLALADPGVPLVDHLTSGFTVLAITSISTANVVLVATRERELVQSRSVAEAAQRALLRPPPERLDGLRTAVRYLAAAADARVGGDLYEALVTPFGTRLLVGDVRGKGLAAVETAADVLGTFREAAQVEPDLAAVAARLDAAVRRRRGRRKGRSAENTVEAETAEEFVTAVLVGVPPSGDVAELVDCGHLPPLLVRAGRVTELESPDPDPPLALLELAGGTYRRRSFTFRAGDVLLLCTDGVTEARDAAGRFYPLWERLARMPEEAPDVLLDCLVTDLLAYARGGLSDDAALLAVRRER